MSPDPKTKLMGQVDPDKPIAELKSGNIEEWRDLDLSMVGMQALPEWCDSTARYYFWVATDTSRESRQGYTSPEVMEMLRYAHNHGVGGYVTPANHPKAPHEAFQGERYVTANGDAALCWCLREFHAKWREDRSKHIRDNLARKAQTFNDLNEMAKSRPDTLVSGVVGIASDVNIRSQK